MKLRNLAVAASLVMLWTASALAADASGRPATADPAAQPAIQLTELKHQFDPVVDGTQVTHDFTVRNAGSGALAINQVKTG